MSQAKFVGVSLPDGFPLLTGKEGFREVKTALTPQSNLQASTGDILEIREDFRQKIMGQHAEGSADLMKSLRRGFLARLSPDEQCPDNASPTGAVLCTQNFPNLVAALDEAHWEDDSMCWQQLSPIAALADAVAQHCQNQGLAGGVCRQEGADTAYEAGQKQKHLSLEERDCNRDSSSMGKSIEKASGLWERLSCSTSGFQELKDPVEQRTEDEEGRLVVREDKILDTKDRILEADRCSAKSSWPGLGGVLRRLSARFVPWALNRRLLSTGSSSRRGALVSVPGLAFKGKVAVAC